MSSCKFFFISFLSSDFFIFFIFVAAFFYIYFFMVLIVKESGIPVSTGEAIMGTMVMKTVAMM